MFFRKSKIKKELEKTEELIRLSQKVYDYRKDILAPHDAKELKESIDALEVLRKKSDVTVAELKTGYDHLDGVAKKCGGNIYPVSFWSENAEMIVVAATLALGIRTFFLQPFAIPTNSMYPTFYGMTSQVYAADAKEPSLAKRIFRKITLGASHYDIKAPETGEVSIPIFTPKDPLSALGIIRFEKVRGFRMLILPTPMREYTLLVGKNTVKIKVPWDFRLEDIIQKTYYPELESFHQIFENAVKQKQIEVVGTVPVLKTGKTVEKSQSVLSFDILAGDMLFVDRFTYNFRYPKIGEPIVFKTINIEGMRDFTGKPEDKYYIKRLVGLAGDTLEIKEPTLFRNGEPITGSPIFDLNTNKVGLYPGYIAAKNLSSGKQEHITEGYFYAMGDNSPYSADSRSWGFVPEKEVIGKAFFIFYPFTKRWGFAK
ncbi:MAG: signal peptidase I [Verrucomicrobia bacterium]|nr:MAG: signal peptidase I [Verrucomicrobiota bacterium]